MESSDCNNTSLDLKLGFRHELDSRLVRKTKKLKHGRSDNKLFPFLALGFSEPNHKPNEDDDDEEDVGDRKRWDAAAVAVASSSPVMFSQGSKLSDEEDEDYSTPSPRKKLRLSKSQISALEDTFKLHSTLNPKQKQELAAQLNLLPRQVEVWFQNRRARVKVKQTEMEREELRRRCEFLKEENRRLKKELAMHMKKKMLLPSSFLMHNNITVCPSCGCCTNDNGSAATSSSFFSSNNTTSKIKLPSVNPFSNQ